LGWSEKFPYNSSAAVEKQLPFRFNYAPVSNSVLGICSNKNNIPK
jgi:hypothetical protein